MTAPKRTPIRDAITGGPVIVTRTTTPGRHVIVRTVDDGAEVWLTPGSAVMLAQALRLAAAGAIADAEGGSA